MCVLLEYIIMYLEKCFIIFFNLTYMYGDYTNLKYKYLYCDFFKLDLENIFVLTHDFMEKQ